MVAACGIVYVNGGNGPNLAGMCRNDIYIIGFVLAVAGGTGLVLNNKEVC